MKNAGPHNDEANRKVCQGRKATSMQAVTVAGAQEIQGKKGHDTIAEWKQQKEVCILVSIPYL